MSTINPTTDELRSVPAEPTDGKRCPQSRVKSSDYWMRSVSFVGLHRILGAVASVPDGLTASQINESVLRERLTPTQRGARPALSTLYHYRNTLLRLRALKRLGRRLKVNLDNPAVRKILSVPVPSKSVHRLDPVAREAFASLVLKNNECRLLFFDLFITLGDQPASADEFRKEGMSVDWWHKRLQGGTTEAVFCSKTTGRLVSCASPGSKNAIMYGLRYWARDELQLIDEYCAPSGSPVTMYPLSESLDSIPSRNSAASDMIEAILSCRTGSDWTEYSVYDLIVQYCEKRRRPRVVLFAVIDWLQKEWPYHVALVPTSPALATLNTTSQFRENLELRRFYRRRGGPYISHIRIHKDVRAAHDGGLPYGFYT